GEEILKQYLLADLRAARRPALTHTYFMAGSEECGLVGLTSQILLALGLQAANLALTQQDWLYGALAVALAPLASYRFGVSGARCGAPRRRAPDGPPLHATAPHPRHRARGDGAWEGVADRVRGQDPHTARHAGPGVPRAAARDPPHPRLLLSPARRRRAGGRA